MSDEDRKRRIIALLREVADRLERDLEEEDE